MLQETKVMSIHIHEAENDDGLLLSKIKTHKRLKRTLFNRIRQDKVTCCTIHELSVLHAWECDSMTRNVVERFASQNRVNWLFDMIGRSDMLSFYGTEQNMCLGHRGLSGTRKTRRRSI